MTGNCFDRKTFLELGDIFRDAELMLSNRRKAPGVSDEIALQILRLASEGRSPSEIRSKVITTIIAREPDFSKSAGDLQPHP